MPLQKAVQLRNKIEGQLYARVAKPIFFSRDPENVHDAVSGMGVLLGKHAVTRAVTSAMFGYKNRVLHQEANGIAFENPVGLAAGFDKNARLTSILPHVGFGWMEVGSITARPCAGNPKPRLYRLPNSESLVVNYGLMNDGSDAIYERIKDERFRFPVGTSLAPTNDEGTMDYRKAIDDYCYSYQTFAATGSYTTLNLSCPNTCNDQPFADPAKLAELLAEIRRIPSAKPLFLKLSPDMGSAAVNALLMVACNYGVNGVICANLTKKRDNPAIKEDPAGLPKAGGMSGKVVAGLSDRMIADIASEWGHTFTVVGCGGVSCAEDAYRKIRLGARLIQMVTGMIYQGPQVVSEINQGLAGMLQRDGFHSLEEAVGIDLKKQ